MIKLYNGDCLKVMDKLIEQGIKVDTVLTSPPYNISLSKGKAYALKYRGYSDCMENSEYIKWTINIFNKLDEILEQNGVILYNINYGTNNNETMWLLIADIIKKTKFTIADNIIWKKSSAFPNSCSSNKITRITENILVICRKTEYKTFHMNKKVVSVRKTGQKMYENVFGFIEAPNNDRGVYRGNHKATYSTELCVKLLNLYGGKRVLDCFMGVGTTGLACQNLNKNFIGIELDKDYYEIAKKRINGDMQLNLFERGE